MKKKTNITDIINRICDIYEDVQKYIYETDHWLFYWITNKEVQNFIKEYPNDYENRVSLIVNEVSTACRVIIKFKTHPDDVEYIQRYCQLVTFRNSVEARYTEYKGNIKEYQLKELRETLEYYKRMVEKTENKIKAMEE